MLQISLPQVGHHIRSCIPFLSSISYQLAHRSNLNSQCIMCMKHNWARWSIVYWCMNMAFLNNYIFILYRWWWKHCFSSLISSNITTIKKSLIKPRSSITSLKSAICIFTFSSAAVTCSVTNFWYTSICNHVRFDLCKTMLLPFYHTILGMRIYSYKVCRAWQHNMLPSILDITFQWTKSDITIGYANNQHPSSKD